MNSSEEVESHIYKKFEILQKLGKGAYGIVWKVMDKQSKKIMALKKVFEAFHNSTDAQRTFREVMILRELSDHDNIVKLLNVIKAENNKDLYLVFDFMETDLHAVIKASILKKVHKQYIIYQLLKGLKYIHSGEIIHRDLKPSNILINSECLIKIADFGLARSIYTVNEEAEPVMTEYVATRWYRAPEIVLGSNRYSKAVDVWSVGCILAELINGKALFPGVSTMNQIELILEVLGKPSKEDVSSIDSENALTIVQNITVKSKKPFASFFKDTSPETIDFLQKCLEFNPAKRFTIEEALGHPFVAQFREPKNEPVLSEPILTSIDDNKKLSTKEYRDALYDDIINKKKEERRVWRQKYMQQNGFESPPNDLPPERPSASKPAQGSVNPRASRASPSPPPAHAYPEPPKQKPNFVAPNPQPSTAQQLKHSGSSPSYGAFVSNYPPYAPSQVIQPVVQQMTMASGNVTKQLLQKAQSRTLLSSEKQQEAEPQRPPSRYDFLSSNVPGGTKSIHNRPSQTSLSSATQQSVRPSPYNFKDIKRPDIRKTEPRPNSSQPTSAANYMSNPMAAKFQYQKMFEQGQKIYTSQKRV